MLSGPFCLLGVRAAAKFVAKIHTMKAHLITSERNQSKRALAKVVQGGFYLHPSD